MATYQQRGVFISKDGLGEKDFRSYLEDGFMVCGHIHVGEGVIVLMENSEDPRYRREVEGEAWKSGSDFDEEGD